MGHLRVKNIETVEKGMQVMSRLRIQQRERTVINGPSISLYMYNPRMGKNCRTLEVEL